MDGQLISDNWYFIIIYPFVSVVKFARVYLGKYLLHDTRWNGPVTKLPPVNIIKVHKVAHANWLSPELVYAIAAHFWQYVILTPVR